MQIAKNSFPLCERELSGHLGADEMDIVQNRAARGKFQTCDFPELTDAHRANWKINIWCVEETE